MATYSLFTAGMFWGNGTTGLIDPHSDPNEERSGYYPVDTVDRPQNGKPAKLLESFIYQGFGASDASSHAGGHWSKSGSLHQIRNTELIRCISSVFHYFMPINSL